MVTGMIAVIVAVYLFKMQSYINVQKRNKKYKTTMI